MIDFFRNNEVISQELLSNATLLVLPGPLNKFTELEMNCIRTFLNSGGNVLVMLGEGGENKSNTNINFLLEEFGIMVNNGNVKKFYGKYIYCYNRCMYKPIFFVFTF